MTMASFSFGEVCLCLGIPGCSYSPQIIEYKFVTKLHKIYSVLKQAYACSCDDRYQNMLPVYNIMTVRLFLSLLYLVINQ